MSRGDHNFAQVPRAEIPRASFDRSSGHKTTFDAGYLIPIFVDEVLPGDTFNLQMTGFGRMATPIFPLMDNAYLDSHWFFVPSRLLWENFERFHGAQDDPGDSIDFLIPQGVAPVGGVQVGSIQDYMGIPTGLTGIEYNSLPIRAYWLIYNEWFRDQNLQNSVVVSLGDGPDAWGAATGNMARRGKRHDYFTSCLPFTQKGDAVSLPLDGFAPVVGITSATPVPIFSVGGGPTLSPLQGDPGLGLGVVWNAAPGAGNAAWDTTALEADLSGATGFVINAVREAFQVQRLLERDARGGTRYTEITRSHFGVVSPDARLQRPEFLGGGSNPLIVSQVPQTSSTDATTPQGNLAAYATVTARDHGFTQSFTEHGYVIGLVSVRADLTYQQGLERFWSRRTRYDFAYPVFSHLGEQAVLNKEIFHSNNPAVDDEPFGYQERYAEYRYKPSRVSGLMRSNATGSLDAWHLAQEFSALPVLDSDFIQENAPFDRVIAIPDEPHFIFDCHIALRCARPLPVFGVPGLVDHF